MHVESMISANVVVENTYALSDVCIDRIFQGPEMSTSRACPGDDSHEKKIEQMAQESRSSRLIIATLRLIVSLRSAFSLGLCASWTAKFQGKVCPHLLMFIEAN